MSKFSLKNVYKSESGGFPTSTIDSIITLVITVLLGLGVLNQVQADGLQANLPQLVGAIATAVGVVQFVIQLFKRNN